ncbi:MAG: hypothetical protein KDI51_06415 [Xanthomonadales bacterium]|nr:hypothetical protein [Xanthomonadales bacterium]MCB1634207.1 hypothetical protein [Xanthomonadales bacterium]
MSADTFLLVAGILLVVLAGILNAMHVRELDPELQSRFLKNGNPARWAILLHVPLVLLFVHAASWPWAMIWLSILVIDIVYFALKQRRHLAALGFPAQWLRAKDAVDLLSGLGMVSLLGSVLYSHWKGFGPLW